MTKRKIVLLSALVIYIIGVAYCVNAFIITHEIRFELMDEIKCKKIVEGFPEKYFVIKDDVNAFYDGFECLEKRLPDYDKAKLDTENYTYFVALNRKIESIKYNGSNCKRRTYFAFPDIYSAIIDCEETNDETVRIYRMKKINIDFDYHSGKDKPEQLIGEWYKKAYSVIGVVASFLYWSLMLIIWHFLKQRKSKNIRSVLPNSNK